MNTELAKNIEESYEIMFRVQTSGRSESLNPQYCNYEGTPYFALNYLTSHTNLFRHPINLVDFGSGKGRLLFYFNDCCPGVYTGVEYDPVLFDCSLKNLHSYEQYFRHRINLIHEKAEKYSIRSDQDVFYFFNPFSLKIFMKVYIHIIESYQTHPRKITLLFFSPAEEYIRFLSTLSIFSSITMLPVESPYKDKKDFFMIYQIG